MAAVNPPFVIQASSHPADVFRRLVRATRPSPGVRLPTDLAVTANGTPNMTVLVAAGEAVIDGTQNVTNQGSYEVLNDATVSLAIAASDPTNPRIDLVVAQVQDASYSGATNAWALAVVTGTPAPSPAVPAAPANSLILAQVAVGALVTTIVAGNITDRRTYLWQVIQPGSTGLHIRNSTNARDNFYVDDNGYVFTQGAISVPPSFGGTLPSSSYGTLMVKIGEATVVGSPASITISGIPSGFKHLLVEYQVVTSIAGSMTMRVNNDSTGNYNYVNYYSTGGAPTTMTVSAAQAQTSWSVGSGGVFGSGGVIWLPNYSAPAGRGIMLANAYGISSSNLNPQISFGDWSPGVAINSITLLTGGTFSSGVISVYGAP